MKLYYLLLLVSSLLIYFLPVESMDGIKFLDKKLEAERGHVELMFSVVYHELMLGGYIDTYSLFKYSNKKVEHLENAIQWLARCYLRIKQDAACCRDERANACVEEYWENQDFIKILYQYILKSDMNKKCLEQIPWVKQKTDIHELPEPSWIARYSNKALNSIPVEIIIPRSKWQETRECALETCKKYLESVT